MGEKKVSLTIRLFSEEKMRIKRCAHDRGVTLSEYVMGAVKERLKHDEIPQEERSDLDLMESALGKISSSPEEKTKPEKSDDKSLMDLIGDYVDTDE